MFWSTNVNSLYKEHAVLQKSEFLNIFEKHILFWKEKHCIKNKIEKRR